MMFNKFTAPNGSPVYISETMTIFEQHGRTSIKTQAGVHWVTETALEVVDKFTTLA